MMFITFELLQCSTYYLKEDYTFLIKNIDGLMKTCQVESTNKSNIFSYNTWVFDVLLQKGNSPMKRFERKMVAPMGMSPKAK